MSNALDRVSRARSQPEVAELQQQLRTANQQISKLEKEVSAMGKALKKHLQHHPQPQKPNLLDRLFSR